MSSWVRRRTPLFHEVSKGDALPPVVKGPMTPMHIMRWSAAIENWHRIHYDHPFATGHDGLPGILVNGSWKQHVVAELLKNWAGADGWVLAVKFRFTSMDVAGDTIIGEGRVADLWEAEGMGFVRCDVVLKNQTGKVSTEGTGVVVLPLSPERALPYPFPRDVAERQLRRVF